MVAGLLSLKLGNLSIESLNTIWFMSIKIYFQMTMEELVQRFQNDVKEFIQW